MECVEYGSVLGGSLSSRGFAYDLRDQLKHRIPPRDGYERTRRRSVLDRKVALNGELEATQIRSQKLWLIDGGCLPNRILRALGPSPEPQFAAGLSVDNPLRSTARAHQERTIRDLHYINRRTVGPAALPTGNLQQVAVARTNARTDHPSENAIEGPLDRGRFAKFASRRCSHNQYRLPPSSLPMFTDLYHGSLTAVASANASANSHWPTSAQR
jgi:hypothetical protein